MAAQSAARAQAAAEEQNARISDEQAKDAIRRGGYEELKHRRQMSILQGSQRAALAASGVSVDSGSALDIQEAGIREGEQDASVIRINAAREAWGYQVQAVNHRNAASAARASGQNAMFSAGIGAATSLLGVTTPSVGNTGGPRYARTSRLPPLQQPYMGGRVGLNWKPFEKIPQFDPGYNWRKNR